MVPLCTKYDAPLRTPVVPLMLPLARVTAPADVELAAMSKVPPLTFNAPPEEMLPPSRFTLNHKPQRYDARIDGDWAEVSVTAENANVDRVKCVREDGKWRVVLELPPLPPIERRVDGGL